MVASLAWIGQPVSPEIVEKARSLWSQESEARSQDSEERIRALFNPPAQETALLSPHPPITSSPSFGVTRLPCGLLCRYRGSSTTQVRNWFTAVWQLLRINYLGRSSCPPRVWQI